MYLCAITAERDTVSFTIGNFNQPHLQVLKGQGSGIFTIGETVVIKAQQEQPGRTTRFLYWNGDAAVIADCYAAVTSVTIPSYDCTIEAVYAENATQINISDALKEMPQQFDLTIIGGGFSIRYRCAMQVSIIIE